MKEDIKQYISEDEDISRILDIKFSSQIGIYAYFQIRLDPFTLQQKGFFVVRLFPFRFSIPDVEKN